MPGSLFNFEKSAPSPFLPVCVPPPPVQEVSPYNQCRELACLAVWSTGDYASAFRHLEEAFAQPDFVGKSVADKQRALRGFSKVVLTDYGERMPFSEVEAGQIARRGMLQALANTQEKGREPFTRVVRRHQTVRRQLQATTIAVNAMSAIIARACDSDNPIFPNDVFSEIIHAFTEAGT